MLACVGYYLPIYRQVSRYPALVDKAVEATPSTAAAAELHAAAWDLVAADITEREQVLQNRFREADGTGLTASDPEQLLAAARDGRVDTLLLAPDATPKRGAARDTGRRRPDRQRRQGDHPTRCRCVPLAVLPLPGKAAALLRY